MAGSGVICTIIILTQPVLALRTIEFGVYVGQFTEAAVARIYTEGGINVRPIEMQFYPLPAAYRLSNTAAQWKPYKPLIRCNSM